VVDAPDGSRQHTGAPPSRSPEGTDPRRPSPRRSGAEQIRVWISWFGLGRLIGSAVAMVVVCAGAYWLVRTPPPPTEALLPRADTTSSAPQVAPSGDPPSASTPSSPSVVATMPSIAVVHVAGAVATAGVYRVEAGARVDDAIRLAGGPTADADIDVVNLAAVVVDGSRIYVPHIGETIRPEVAPTGAGGGVTTVAAGPVNVNVATVEELDQLPGVGPATAAAILTERERNGPFVSVDDLDRVPGIGPAKLDALRDLVTT
jgi:competence protein ComEA